ncbi:MAG: hypothetical protein K2N47_04515, partial [Clostridia bacterium]|nr:hypothetical protein [Clostridia bacterium]
INVYDDDEYYFINVTGSLKNISDESVTITRIEVDIVTTGTDILGYSNKTIELAPGAIFDFAENDFGVDSYDSAIKVSKVAVTVEGVTYTLYDGDFIFLPIILFVFAGIFLIISIISLVGANKQQKRYNAIVEDLSKMQCHAVFALGTFNQKGDGAKTAATVATTVMFGAIAGFGVSKATGSDFRKELILTDGGLYWCNMKGGKNAALGADLSAMNFTPRAGFAYSQVTRNKKSVVIRNSNGESFTFNLKNNTQITPEELEARLIEFATPAPVNNTPAPAPADPFGGEAAATQAPAQSANAAPEKSGGASISGDDPFNEIK